MFQKLNINFNLPEYFVFGDYSFSSFIVFLIIAFCLVSYVVWKEGRRDGFSEERLFDVFIGSFFIGFLFSRLLFAFQNNLAVSDILFHIIKFWIPGTSVLGYLLGVGLFLYIASTKLSWSVYRILDIFSLGYTLGLSIIMLGFLAFEKNFNLIFAFSAYLLLYVLLNVFRNSNFKSGYIFTLFIFFNIIISAVFYRDFYYYILYSLGLLYCFYIFVKRSSFTLSNIFKSNAKRS